MPVNHELKCIFVHITKTAGTSIEAALSMHGDLDFIGVNQYFGQKRIFVGKNRIYKNLFGDGLQHLTAKKIKKHIKNYDEYFSFAFVRNPFERIVSAVGYQGGLSPNKKPLTPKLFRQAVKTRSLGKLHRKLQYDYIYSRTLSSPFKPKLLVNFVGKFENLHNDFKEVCKRINIEAELEHRMITKHKHYTEYYDDETYEIVARQYAKDIKHFGYKFGD